MSTFDGRVAEFPDIRIDYFRPSPNPGDRPALAYFLSHVHSDHLIGLDSCNQLFVYCSPATRDILLKLEKYPHRMNFAKGILESRRQTYKHLRRLLKAIPLETPTVIELAPGRSVRVVLFDANHCVGAVSFLIEGDGKAVLYTGDVRCEAWWVNSLVRNPLMVQYTGARGKKLDCVYLDTTFATSGEEGRYCHFPSKAEGLQELVEKVSKYPVDTLFYFDSWTFGYEDVYQTLSHLLNTPIHVDDYRYGLYRALANGPEPKATEATKLMGFKCGNHYQEGCLTDGESRLHSCEYGAGCSIWEKDFVRITPIISRHNGVEMKELGAGGGQGDLNPQHELELYDTQLFNKLIEMCEARSSVDPELFLKLKAMLSAIQKGSAGVLKLDTDALPSGAFVTDVANEAETPFDQLAIEKLLTMLVQQSATGDLNQDPEQPVSRPPAQESGRSKQITFPYSRHASYHELRLLIAALHPGDIFPCTVDEKDWQSEHSMEFLFGDLYSHEMSFRHEQVMRRKAEVKWRAQELQRRVQQKQDVQRKKRHLSSSPPVGESQSPTSFKTPRVGNDDANGQTAEGESKDGRREEDVETEDEAEVKPEAIDLTRDDEPREWAQEEVSLARRTEAWNAASGVDGRQWSDISLVSCSSGHQAREEEM